MREKILIFNTALLLVVSLSGFPSAQPPSEELPLTVCPEGPPQCQFSTIGAAIDAASPYDLIQVYPGTYRETLTISKSLRLVATEPERVVLQGAHTGEPTLTLQVQDRLDITIEGLTLLAPPDPESTGTCQDRRALVCSNGIDIRGEGALGLTLVNVQITQRENQSATGIDCSQFTGTAQVVLRQSRISANREGLDWTCPTSGSLEIQHTLVSGNYLGGVSFFGSRGETMEVSVEESLFTANGVAIELDGEGLDVIVKGSEFLDNNKTGIFANLHGDSLLEISGSLLLRNRAGVVLGGPESFIEGTQFLLQDSRVLGNREEGVIVWTVGEVELRNNLIEGNGHGVRVVQASNRLALYENQVVRNEGWGVALDQSECFSKPFPIAGLGPEVKKVFRIVGKGNEIHDNGQGDLCPEWFNWPEDFMEP
jgi:hypothetical protein